MQISLRGLVFQVDEPFQPGHRLTAEEAAALNHLRAEQIKSNMRRAVDLAIHRAPDGQVTSEQALALQSRIDFLSKLHCFKFQTNVNASTANLHVEALRVAEERLEQSARLHDTEMPHGQSLEEACQAWAQKPEVIEEARMRLAEKQRIAIQALEELA